MIKSHVLHEMPVVRVPGTVLDDTIHLRHIDEPQELRFRLFRPRDINPVEVIKDDKIYKGIIDTTEQRPDSISLFTGKTLTTIFRPDTLTHISSDLNGEKHIKVLSEISSRAILQYVFTSLTWTPSYFAEFIHGSWNISMNAIVDSDERLETDVTLVPYKGIHCMTEYACPVYNIGKVSISLGKTYMPIILDSVCAEEVFLFRMLRESSKIMHALMVNSKMYLPPGRITINSGLPPVITDLPEMLPEANTFIDMLPSESVTLEATQSTIKTSENNFKTTLNGKLKNRYKEPVNVYIIATGKISSPSPNYRWIKNGEVVYLFRVPERGSIDVDVTVITENNHQKNI